VIVHGILQGHPSLTLENQTLQVTVLPEKGADIYALVYKPAGIDVLMKTPWGLHPPADRPPADFLDNYEGGWQELFPSVNDACVVGGESIPFHGEVALLPWEVSEERDQADGCSAVFTVRTRKTPFRLRRRMQLSRAAPGLVVEETVWNESDEAAAFVWGHHVVLGAPFLEDGCSVDMPGRELYTPDELYEPASAQLAAAQQETWPMARGRAPGEWIDLRNVPGPDAHIHDEAYITGLGRGHLSVLNPHRRLKFSLDWDPAVFRWVVLWRPYGGADLPPLTGIFGLGVEPWVTRYDLGRASQRGEALNLGPRQSISTRLIASISEGRDPASGH